MIKKKEDAVALLRVMFEMELSTKICLYLLQIVQILKFIYELLK